MNEYSETENDGAEGRFGRKRNEKDETKFACNIEVIFYFYGITKEQLKKSILTYKRRPFREC